MAKEASNVVPGTDEEWDTVVAPYGPTFPFENDGDALTGTYLSVKQVEQDDMANPGEKRMANVYAIRSDSDGTEYSVWGTYAIDEAFKDGAIVEGQTVRIIFNGKIPIDNGKRTVNQFTVQVKK
jgi:hypothetical protein